MPAASRQKRRKKLAAGAAVALGAALSPEAMGAVITVNSTADTVAVDTQCTLREALSNANDDAATNADCTAGSGADTIDFTGLTLPATITLGGTSLPITDAVTIDGPGAADLTIDANETSRIFTIDDDDPAFAMNVDINGMTLINGDSSPEPIDVGGAILNAENLTLTDVTFSDNTSLAGGAVFHEGGQVPPTLTANNSTFTGNTASYGGAILSAFADVEITDSTFTLNAVDCCGGAINQSSGNFSITGSTVTGNAALVAGGIALYYVTNITVSNTTISGNYALAAVGGLYLYAPQGTVTIESSVISGNDAGISSGGLHIARGGEGAEISIVDTEISGNTAGVSAGLYLYDVYNVSIERMRLIDNTATYYAGAGSLFDAEVTIVESQITGNEAESVGGLYVAYGSYLYLTNSTIAGNTATVGSVGGLGVNTAFAAIEVSTISGNSAPAGAAGNIFTYGAGLYVENSVIANGTAIAGPDMVNVDSSVTLDYSLLEDTAGAVFTGANNLTGVDPQLGPLADNGGPTETLKPVTGSPVIDAGDPTYTTPPNDQRGFLRPINVVDMGAVEVNPGVLTLSTDSYNTAEGNGFVTITVNRTGGSDGAVSVNYTTSDGTALAGLDYTLTSGTLNWADGDSLPKTFNVPITDDVVFEGTENFGVGLNTVVGASLGTFSAQVAIADNETAPTISVNNTGAVEGHVGNTPAPFTIELSHPTTQTVTVNYDTASGTATVGTDFVDTNGTLQFDPLVTELMVNVPVIGDTIDEADETFTFTLDTPENATILDGTGVATITDDDLGPTLAIGDVTQVEGTGVNPTFAFNVSLTGATEQTVTVNYTTAGVTATTGTDFTATSGTLTFNPGTTSLPVNVTVVADAIDEANETFHVTLNTPGNATITDDTGLGTITDDDASPTLSIGDVTQLEGTGANPTFAFNVSLAGATEQTVTVNYSTAGVTATTGTDFTATSGTLTFNPGTTSLPVNVTVVADAIDEPDETFNVNLDTPNAATILDGTGLGTVTDDDATPTISIGDVTQLEGTGPDSVFTFNVTLSGASQNAVTVDYSMAGVSATNGVDFVPTSGTLTFNPGTTSLPIIVQVIADPVDEPNETFNVTLANPNAAATILDGTGLGTITDDDGAPALTIDNVTLAEGNAGTTNFVFTVTLAPASGQTVTVDYNTQAVSATAGADYTTTAGTLTFLPGDTSETITVPVNGENAVEPDEVFNVVLSNAPLATISDNTGVGTILNDDLPVLNIDDVTLAEGNAGPTSFLFTVSLSAPSTQQVTVNYTTADVSANAGSDYALTAGALTFVPGDTSETISVPVTGDTSGEATETFNVLLSGPSMAALGDDTGVGTIVNDDTDADLSVTKDIVGSGPFEVGGNATFTITVTNAGPATATNVVVSDTLPAGTSLVSATPTSGSCTGTVTVQCNVGTLANGGRATITLIVQLDTAGNKSNTATAASDLFDASGASDTEPFAVAGPAGLPGQAIPTLNEWMLIALASALAAAAALKLKPQ